MGAVVEVLGVLISGLGAFVAAAVSAYLTRRSAEPSDAEVRSAESLASEALATSGSTQSTEPELVAPMTTAGDEAAKRILRDYATDLRKEASRIAKRAGAEHPSAAHARLAADRLGILRERASILADIGLGIGGLLLGAAISYGINLWTGGTAEPGTAPMVMIVGTFGAVIFAISATVKWVRR